MKTRHWLVAWLLVLAWSPPAPAQLAPPNDMGVALGHIHVAVKDVEAQKRFWTDALGGTLVTNGPLTLVQFPGVFIMLRQADAAEPAAGSVFDHFGFVYKDIAAARARWKAAGVKFDVGEVNPNQGYVYAPDSGIRVEVFGDPSLPGSVGMDHVHLYPTEADIPAMQAWYARACPASASAWRGRGSSTATTSIGSISRSLPAPGSSRRPGAARSITSAST